MKKRKTSKFLKDVQAAKPFVDLAFGPLFKQIEVLPPSDYQVTDAALPLVEAVIALFQKRNLSHEINGFNRLVIALHVLQYLPDGETPPLVVEFETVRNAVAMASYYVGEGVSLNELFPDPNPTKKPT